MGQRGAYQAISTSLDRMWFVGCVLPVYVQLENTAERMFLGGLESWVQSLLHLVLPVVLLVLWLGLLAYSLGLQGHSHAGAHGSA